MSWFLILMLFALPAAILLLVFIWLLQGSGGRDDARLWLGILLLVDLMLFPMAYYGLWGLFSQSLFVFLEMPFVIGLLAVMLINWRKYAVAWENYRSLLAGLSLVMIALLALMVWGSGITMLAIPLYALVFAGLWQLLRRLRGSLLNVLALVTLSVLVMEATGSLNSRMITAVNWRGAISIFGEIGILLAFILQTLLIQRAFGMEADQERGSPWIQYILATLLLIGVGAVEMRHGVLAEATGRAFEDHLPFLSLLLTISAGVVLIISLPGRLRFAGAIFMIVGTAWIMAAYSLGWRFDPEQITQARAERITQAIESYDQQNGSYPDSLIALTPSYLPLLLGPLTGHDQVWCYQGGQNFYRLGYVWYQRYARPVHPSPHIEIKIFSSSGQPADQPWVCDQELQRFKPTIGF